MTELSRSLSPNKKKVKRSKLARALNTKTAFKTEWKQEFPFITNIPNDVVVFIIIIIIIAGFILMQEIRFTESLLNWKALTGPNSTQLPFLYVITQAFETMNIDLGLDYLHLLKTNFNNHT